MLSVIDFLEIPNANIVFKRLNTSRNSRISYLINKEKIKINVIDNNGKFKNNILFFDNNNFNVNVLIKLKNLLEKDGVLYDMW